MKIQNQTPTLLEGLNNNPIGKTALARTLDSDDCKVSEPNMAAVVLTVKALLLKMLDMEDRVQLLEEQCKLQNE